MTDFNALLNPLADIARDAGKAILDVYERDDHGVETKDDKSPITEADKAAHVIIERALQALTPDIPVFSEESGGIDYPQRKDWPRFWLVDPLDGTKEFIKRNGEFTVNIALVEGDTPVLGVVHVPVTGVTYLGGEGVGAFKEENGQRQPIRCRARTTPVVMVASRSHGGEAVAKLEAFIREEVGDVERASMGSSLKLCLVAEGKADIYPRLAPTSEWDTAAAHAVVSAAGGQVVDTAFQPLRYNKEDILNPFFLVLGQSVDDWRFIAPAIA
ncbi:MAG: 3'(2'),5'-bisphosphate nucleotidase CysQ [Alcanivorax sp.]|nr:3'(2'),5'-bisphosphate nucleotidase CysQ [Alcanivorax sp.]